MAKKLVPDEERLFYEALAYEESDWPEQQYVRFLAGMRAKEERPLIVSVELAEWLAGRRGNRPVS